MPASMCVCVCLCIRSCAEMCACWLGLGRLAPYSSPATHTEPTAATHGPEQLEVLAPVVFPNRPAGQTVQPDAVLAPTEPLLYCPAGHSAPVEFIAADGQYLPVTATHGPPHDELAAPASSHSPRGKQLVKLHKSALVEQGSERPLRQVLPTSLLHKPAAELKLPAGHGAHAAPAAL